MMPPSPHWASSPLNSSQTSFLSPGSDGSRSPASSSDSGSSHSIQTTSSFLRSPRSPKAVRFVSTISQNGTSSMSEKYSLDVDPASWGAHVLITYAEPDDVLHNPDPRRDRNMDSRGHILTLRGLVNLGCLILLGLAFLTLFAGYPIITFFTKRPLSTLGGFNIGGINATGQIPSIPGNRGLIDVDTPKSALYIQSFNDDTTEYQLVFSDEFNTDGRSFYPGDDPYWEAVDLHYWQTGNLEWYDPAAITTKDGALKITLSKKKTHDLNYQGGMMSTWNKFCFTGGLVLTSVVLPGANNVVGLWPAVWTMGNLGRAGFGASLEGIWPYSYDSCDVGTAPNQTLNGLPLAALTEGDPYNDNVLSYLPGQRLSRCTCPGESHPGPVHSDGTYVGRSAPEIDIFEAQVNPSAGQVSQSAQWAPFNANYAWANTTNDQSIADDDVTQLNQYRGGVWQESTSALSNTNQDCYELNTGCFAIYGFEYKPGYDNSYITWINDNQRAWTLLPGAVAADSAVEISARPISQEPMYIIANLGMSPGFGTIDFEHLTFPATMSIDWIRVYQPKNAINIGCDPPDYPTKAYINAYIDAYTNPNFTTWKNDYNQPFPKNSFLGQC